MMKKQVSALHYDENGYSKATFDKDDFKVRIRIDARNSTIYIVRDDNLLTLFKKKLKTTRLDMMQKRARVYIMKFCGITLPKKRNFTRRGKHVGHR